MENERKKILPIVLVCAACALIVALAVIIVVFVLHPNRGDDAAGKAKSTATPTVTPITPGVTPGPLTNVDRQMICEQYAVIFPKDSFVREHETYDKGLFVARLELSAEEWEKAKAEMEKQEWHQENISSQFIPGNYVGATITLEESERFFDAWFSIHYVDIPEHRAVDEWVHAMYGDDEDTIVILYRIWVYHS